jgi:signal transduction histidine kinase
MAQRERERVEIARDLHDGPLQEMIAINFGLTEALQFSEKEERLRKISFLQDAIQRQIRDLREFCSELRPPALAPFGLEKAILSHADTFRFKYPNILLHLDLMKDAQTLDESLRLSLYRIYQELIHNVVRHSGATEVTVRLWLDTKEVTLLVEDNGHGFAMPPEWVELARQGHMGLVGVRERAESLQGTVQVFSSESGGTTVVVTVPREA